MIYLLLFAGLFMGWSLGTNDAANAFGTAVSTRVVKYRTAIIIIAVMVMIGTILQGHEDILKLSSIATNNKMAISVEELKDIKDEDGKSLVVFEQEQAYEKDKETGKYVLDENGDKIPLFVKNEETGEFILDENGNKIPETIDKFDESKKQYVIDKEKSAEFLKSDLLKDIRLKSTLKAAIIFLCGAVTVFVMSYLKFPVSANQSITGAIIGWGLCYANYSDKAVRDVNIAEILKFMSTWFINPVGAAVISFVLVFVVKKFLENRLTSMKSYDKIVKIGYLIAGAIAAYSIGANSSASVTAFYFDSTGAGVNLLSSARLTAIVGGLAIAIGVLTYSKKVMMTVGSSIAEISQIDGFLVIVAMALTVLIMKKLMGIPVSTSQSAVGAVVGAGLVNGIKKVNFGVFKNIAIAWVSSPTVAGLLAFIIGWCTKGYFAA